MSYRKISYPEQIWYCIKYWFWKRRRRRNG